MFIVVLTVLGGPGCAAWDSTHSMLKEVGYGAGSVFGTLVYASFKASFCILGAIGSACTLPLGTEMAEKVVGASCQGTGGTWVITPDLVKGREAVRSVGYVPPARGRDTK
jgi:hypothetical protein